MAKFTICKECNENVDHGRITHLRKIHGFKGKAYVGMIKRYFKEPYRPFPWEP